MELGYYHAPGQAYYYGLWDLLGTAYVADGNPLGNVSQLRGQAAWFGAGLTYGYPYGQPPDSWVDVFGVAAPGAMVQFKDQNGIPRTISYAPEGLWRTVTSAVCFGAFAETAPLSTQQRLMARIVAFLLRQDTTPPGPLAEVQAQLTGTALLMTWEPVTVDAQGNPETVDSYLIERANGLAGPWTALALVPGTSYSATLAGVGNPNVNVVYRVRAVDQAGNQGSSAAAGEFDYWLQTP